MTDICREQPPLDLPDSHESSDSFSSLFGSYDDTVVSNVVVANSYDQQISSKKMLTCHACSVDKRFFRVKNNITVVFCSRLGCSSSSPKLIYGNPVDTKLLLKKVEKSVTFRDAVNDIRSQIIPEILDEETITRLKSGEESFTLSKDTVGVAKARKNSSTPIEMQEMLLFLPGCFKQDEGVYELDEHGEVRDISEQYGLIERPYDSREARSNFKACSYLDYVVRSDVGKRTAAEVKHKQKMTDAITYHESERDRLVSHIEKLTGYTKICLFEQVPDIEMKIKEYTKKLETVTKNIDAIQKMRDSIAVDGKYFLRKHDMTPHDVVPLSHILNHPSNIDGTLFIVKVCRNMCGEHLPEEQRYTSLKGKSSDDSSDTAKMIFSNSRRSSPRRPSRRSPSPIRPRSPRRPISPIPKSQKGPNTRGRSRDRSIDKNSDKSGGKIVINKPNKCRHKNRNKYRRMLTRRKRNNVTKKKLNKR